MQPEERAGIDLLKVNLVSDYHTSWLMAFIGIYFGLMIGLTVAWYQTQLSFGVSFYILAGFLDAVLFALLVTQEVIPYREHLKRVDRWLAKIERKEPLPELSKMYRSKNSLKPIGHGIVVLLLLLDFILALNGVPALWLYAAFLPVGALILFFTNRRPRIPDPA